MNFDQDQLKRYSRNISLENVGRKGQERISSGRVLVIGAGGLGSPAILYLAAAGIGTLGIADGDKVDLTNLQRQIIHFTTDLGRPKVISAREKIEKLNPDVKVNVHEERVAPENIRDIVGGYDYVIDATDNFRSKFLINDTCVLLGKPFSHCGVLAFEGQTMTYAPGSSCYRCVFPDEPSEDDVRSSSQIGILGAVAGIFGAIMATEAVKYLTGTGNLLTDRLLVFDGLKMTFREVEIRKNPGCSVCGKGVNP